MLLARLLKRLVQTGEIHVIDATGRRHCFGAPGSGPSVTIRLHDRRLHHQLFLNPRLRLGEAYMDGTLTVEDGSIYDFLDITTRNIGFGPMNGLDRWLQRGRMLWRGFQQANPLGRAQRNVAHHYDLSDELYDLFLDSDRQYSCGYFPTPDASLEAAQVAKKRHIAAKLLLEPGQKVLDIGSGWGGLALYLAREADVTVDGVTLSTEQHKVSQRRAEDANASNRVAFHLRDYREVSGRYDRIVSVGMFEHVGVPHYEEYFTKVRDLLTDDGVALIHTISHCDAPCSTNPWLRKYIFPGGYCPSLSEILKVTERLGLWVTDIEILRLHYAETLRHWRERFLARRAEAEALYDARFCRMWEFYLAGSEVSFRNMGQTVAQIQISKSIDAVPLTRDYITDWERAEDRYKTHEPPRLKSVS